MKFTNGFGDHISVSFKNHNIQHPKASTETVCRIDIVNGEDPDESITIISHARCSKKDTFTAYGRKLAFHRAVESLDDRCVRTEFWQHFAQADPCAFAACEQQGC